MAPSYTAASVGRGGALDDTGLMRSVKNGAGMNLKATLSINANSWSRKPERADDHEERAQQMRRSVKHRSTHTSPARTISGQHRPEHIRFEKRL